MVDDRAPFGLLIAALGAAVLAVSVFSPWYGVSITPTGVASAKQELAVVARQYGNSELQSRVRGIGDQFNSLVGRQLTTVTARQTMGRTSTILLALAGIALLASLLRLADMHGALMASGGQVALLGALASAVVLFRMVWRPHGPVNFISLSLSWGILLALASAGLIVIGGLIAGSARTDRGRRHKVGPGPPPLGRDTSSPDALARVRP
jgi:hypothetical protein